MSMFDDHTPRNMNVGIQGVSAALAAISWGMCYCQVTLLQMSKWWVRDTSGMISIGNMDLLDQIAVFTLPVPILPELQCQLRSFARAPAPSEASRQTPYDKDASEI